MPNDTLGGDGATSVGIAWVVKECLFFLIKARKDKAEAAASPSEDLWKEYCRDKFEQITTDIRDRIDPLADELREVRHAQEFLRNQLQDLKIEHRKCLGKD